MPNFGMCNWCVYASMFTKPITLVIFVTAPVGGGGDDVESWEDIAADDPKPAPTTDAQPSTVPAQVTVTSSEPDTTSNTSGTTEPSPKETTGSPSNEKEADGDTSDPDLTVRTSDAKATETKNGDQGLVLKAKEQSNQSSPSNTPLPKAKTVAAPTPQRAEDDKENVNIVFIGHVDAGKSTIGGHVMLVLCYSVMKNIVLVIYENLKPFITVLSVYCLILLSNML